MPTGAQAEGAAAGLVGIADGRLGFDQNAAGGEVRTGDELQQFGRGGLRIGVDEVESRFAELGDIVGRHRGRHAHGDALRAVGEEVGEVGRQHYRFFVGAVIGRLEVDGVLGHALEQEARDGGHLGFGVAIGGGLIAIYVAEIALPVDERVAHGKVLRQADQRIVDRLIAMRVETADHVTDDLGRLAIGAVGIEAQQTHHMQDAAMHGLQTVAGIGQRTLGDGRKRIAEVPLLQRLAQVDDAVVFVIGRQGIGVGHLGFRGRANHRASIVRTRCVPHSACYVPANISTSVERVAGGSIWRADQIWRSRK